jgi:thiol-disulfide isomerase/thioredoxin
MMYFRCASSHTIQKSISICGLLCLVVIVSLSSAAADSLSTHPVIVSHCSAPTLQESFLEEPVQDFCKSSSQECPSKHDYVASERPQSTRVAELNETTLEKALDLVHTSNGTYIAVLYYATWCPFSRQVRPVYDVLSALFPTVHHVAVEESSVRPSVLSQYGVHSFPILFMHNRTARVRYYGPRNLEYLKRFYQNYTGLSVAEGEPSKKEDCAFARLVYNAGTDAREGCPYPWAISPEKWLQDDMYLNLAVVFLVLSQVGDEADVKTLGAGTANGLYNASIPSKPPAQGAPQSSSAAVAESSSSRAGPSGEAQDMDGQHI